MINKDLWTATSNKLIPLGLRNGYVLLEWLAPKWAHRITTNLTLQAKSAVAHGGDIGSGDSVTGQYARQYQIEHGRRVVVNTGRQS